MRKIIAAVMGIALLSQTVGFAADIAVERDIQNAVFTVSGTAEKNSVITVGVYAPNSGPADIETASRLKDVLKYHDEVYADSEGNFNLIIGFDNAVENTFPSGVYPMLITVDGVRQDESLEYIEYSKNNTVLTGLAAAPNMVDYIEIGNNRNDLGFFNPLYDNLDKSKVESYMKAESTSYASPQEAVDAFNEAVIARALSENDIQNMSAYEKQLILLNDGSKLAKWYKEARKANVDAAVLGQSYTNPQAFRAAVTKAVVLDVVSNADGYLTIKAVIEDFATEIGIVSPTDKQAVYKNLAGRTYTTYEELVSEYQKNLSAESVAPGGNGGGGGGSSSSGRVSLPSGGIGTVDVPTPIKKSTFADMVYAAWAEPAVTYLVEKNIVSGRNSEEFCPNDTVLREEFVTMVVRAFDVKKAVDANEFSDVTKDNWYYEYVLAASQNELVSGLGNGVFGAGTKITRQDMATILYRAVTLMGINVEAQNQEAVFTDYNGFADYAKEAISYLQMRGVVSGMEDGSFCPNDYAQRAQAAQMIYKILIGMEE